MTPEEVPAQEGVLTPGEEVLLACIREALEEARARGVSEGLPPVHEALLRLGAEPCGPEDGSGSRRYVHARVAVLVAAVRAGKGVRLVFPGMVALAALVLGPALSGRASSPGDTNWSLVPVSAGAHVPGVLPVHRPPDESVVRLVGAVAAEPAADPKGTVRSDLPMLPAVAAPAVSGDAAIPDGTRWPDAGGTIDAAPPVPAETLRNPWQPREPRRPAASATFTCGAVLIGGARPVATVNGRIVRTGASIGKFGVGAVVAEGVVVSLGGATYMLPRGRRTVIKGLGD